MMGNRNLGARLSEFRSAHPTARCCLQDVECRLKAGHAVCKEHIETASTFACAVELKRILRGMH